MPFLQEYTMLDELGKGGFATVYKVRHNALGYIRAVRVLNETIVDANSPTYQKFLRECKVLLRLGNGSHPNIVHIYQPRLLENKALVEMDYVDGLDIMHYLKQNQKFVPVEEVIRMASQISSALAYCHEDIYRFCMDKDFDNLQDDPNDGSKVLLDKRTRENLITKYKVIHNDIHSGNIMRREDGNFVLLDFGLAINGDEVVRSSRHANGAPEFKAPEKWDDETILTEQSDIYSFGIVLYEMLAGRVPFPMNKHLPNYKAENAVAEAHQKLTPPSIETLRKEFFESKYEGREYKKDYPKWMEDVILKCLRKNPADRFRNGKELFAAVTAGIAWSHTHETESMKFSVAKLKNERDELLLRLQKQDEILRNEQNELQEKYKILETDKHHLTEERTELQNQIERLVKEQKRLDEIQDGLQKQKTELESEWNSLRREQEKTHSSWWKMCSVIMFLLLAASGCLWYLTNNEISDLTVEVEEKKDAIDSLQQMNKQLLSEIKKMEFENFENEKALMLNQKSNVSSDNSTYKGHDAEYWYNKYNEPRPTSTISTYKGHDAEYWYNKYNTTKQDRAKYKKMLNDAI